MPQPLTEHAEVKASFWQGSRFFISEYLHFFTIAKDLEKFSWLASSGSPVGLGSL
jgi:hypothetical protein